MKKLAIVLSLLVVVSSASASNASKKTLVVKRWKYEMCSEWNDMGGKIFLNRRVTDSTYRNLFSSQSQFIKIDSLAWSSLRNSEKENKNFIFADEISIRDHHDYWEVSIVVGEETTKLPINFKSYWDVDDYVIHNFERLRERLIEKMNVSLEEEKSVPASPVYTPKWTPKFTKEQDRKKHRRN